MLATLKKIKKRYWIIGGIILLILLLIVIRKNNAEPYSTYTVTRTDVSDELLLAGTIDARDRVDLGFASSGRIKAVNVHVGDEVKKGDIIAEIEQNRLVADL
ncbi:biotin/lipoyl-binding protein, partial [Patescibacteria group bacterium]|nr:biotin/lipoyl-binding protein [Patescibacteria group bacterium]